MLKSFLQRESARRAEVEKINRFTRYSEALLEEGDAQGAEDALLMALQAAPDNVQCHNNLGVFYWKTGQRQKSVRHFAGARELDPDHRETVWNCGQIMADIDEHMMARHIYVQYMRENGFDEEMTREINNL